MNNCFVGEAGRQALIDTLKDQKMVVGNMELATSAELLEIKSGQSIPEAMQKKIRSSPVQSIP